VFERERGSLCVRVRERERVCVCEREEVCVCVCTYVSGYECVLSINFGPKILILD